MEKWQVKQRQSLPLEIKILMTIRRIVEWYEYWNGDVYVSFSGGKDSTVLAHLVNSIYPDVPLVFCNTGLEYPEIVQFVKTFRNVEWLKPKMSFVQVIEKYGLPIATKEQAHYIKQVRRNPDAPNSRRILTGVMPDGRKTGFKLSEKWKPLLKSDFKISDECCAVMKKQPFKTYENTTKQKPFIGIVGGESIIRNQNYLKTGCNAFESSRPKSTPMAFWTEQDVLQYISDENLKIAEVYGDIYKQDGIFKTSGVSRTGCMFCAFGVHLEPEPNRFQMMKKTHPKLWEYCMYKLPIGAALDFIGVNYGQQVSLFDEYGA